MTTAPALNATQVFATIDAGDTAGFVALFSNDGRFTFGNSDPLVGLDAIRAGVGYFYSTIKTLRHTVINEWSLDNTTIIELSVEYDRLDGATVSVPCVTIWQTEASGLIDSYRIFADLSPVYT